MDAAEADALWWEASCRRLGDPRRARTLRRVRRALAAQRGQPWSRALGPGLRQAGGDLVARRGGQAEDLLAGDYAVCAARCAEAGWVILSGDSSAYDYSGHRATCGLGRLRSRGRGFWGHSVLALSRAGRVLGLLDTECWTRSGPALAGARRQRAYRDKESLKWARSAERATGRLPAGVRALLVTDRESDIFAYFAAPRRAGVELLVRLAHPRRLAAEGELDLLSTLALAARRAVVRLRLPAQPNRPARDADLTLRWACLPVRSPRNGWEGPAQSLWLWVLEAREEDPPPGAKRLRWVLASTQPIDSPVAAAELLRVYALRWTIEVWHRSLKTEGLRVERLQLRTVERLQQALAIYQGVAVDLLAVLHESREHPERPAVEVFEADELAVLAQATRREVSTLGQAVAAVAVLAGWPGHPRSPRPGITVFSDGYRALHLLVIGYRLGRGAPPPSSCCNDP